MHSLGFRTWTRLAESSLGFPEMKIQTLFFSHDLWSPWEQVGKLRLASVTTQAHSLQMLPCPGPLVPVSWVTQGRLWFWGPWLS